ncbi:MAG: hypothetical protein II890_06145 [Spirochaetia bacterium]|nr:hypothetical protein [Spirochaetia bacterium]MBR0318023.1 hypothetical protein [Spirochaetia bacterium]
MKRNVLLVLILFLIIIGVAFAEGTAEERTENIKNSLALKAMQQDMNNRKFDVLARGYSDSYFYILAKDANWRMFLYRAYVGSSGSYDGNIYLYQEDGKATKESIKNEVDKGRTVSKIIDDSYVAFKIDGWPDKYYIKTQKGDFYSVSKLIRESNNAASFTGIDDFLN